VCFDLDNVAPVSEGGFTITTTAAQLGVGAGTDYLNVGVPLALQTPYEQWLPGVVPFPFAGGANFIQRRDAWFGNPTTHFGNLFNANAMPNFIRLNDLGPKRHAFRAGTDRNIVERTLADADGDGFTDSFWFLLPGVSEDGIRQVAAVSVIDNASMVDVNVATRFDRWSTAGHTPSDIALTSRLVQPGAQATAFGANDAVYDPFDTWVGLFSDPQNASPANGLWNLSYAYDANFEVQPETFAAPETLRTGFDPLRFGDSPAVPSSFLRQTGVLNQDPSLVGFDALEAPYRSLMVAFSGIDPGRAESDRRRYFHRRLNSGGLFVDLNPDGTINGNVLNVPPRGFTDADELELRMFAASNYGPAVSTLERTLNEPWNYQANFLRSSLARSESVENFLDYFDGLENTPWPPSQGIAIGDQLSAIELLRDNRHRITTYSSTRNDLRPLHLRPTALYDPTYDYAFGRLRSDLNSPPNPQANQLAFDVRKQKLDLRAPSDTPLTEFESILYRYFPGPFNARASVQDESQILSELKHVNVIELKEVFLHNSLFVFVMELARGGTLMSLIYKEGRPPAAPLGTTREERDACRSMLDEERARELFRQILAAVEFCHRCHVVHRDLKPENILLDDEGTVKVADFGLSTIVKPFDLAAGLSCGTPSFMAPELFAHKRQELLPETSYHVFRRYALTVLAHQHRPSRDAAGAVRALFFGRDVREFRRGSAKIKIN
jgi:hypothetical protein